MTKQRTLFITFLTVFYGIGILTGYCIKPEKTEYITKIQPQSVNVPVVNTAAEEEKKPVYFVKLENGVINMYSDENGEMSIILSIDYINLYSVPQAQLERLKRGEYFESRESAAEFIQDLDS